MSTTINLHCWLHGDDSGRIFPVEIAATKTVGALKDEIKDKMRPAFDHIPDKALVLWKVSIPVNKSFQDLDKLDFDEGNSLLPTEVLEDVFLGTLPQNHLHIVVKPRAVGKCHKHLVRCK